MWAWICKFRGQGLPSYTHEDCKVKLGVPVTYVQGCQKQQQRGKLVQHIYLCSPGETNALKVSESLVQAKDLWSKCCHILCNEEGRCMRCTETTSMRSDTRRIGRGVHPGSRHLRSMSAECLTSPTTKGENRHNFSILHP